MGKVDKLGRFISEVDPEPDVDKKKKGNLPALCTMYIEHYHFQ